MPEEHFLHICFCVMAFIFGACFGSFSNVLIYRMPIGENIAKSASHCTVCNKKIAFYDNIPIISYIVLGGKCRNCKAPISPRYVIVESLNALIWLGFALLAPIYGYAYSVMAMFLATALIAVAFIDYAHGYIPDSFNIFIAVIGAIACFFDKTYVLWQSRLIGCGFALVFFGGFYLIWKFIFKKEGLGLGDVKLMTVCGLALGIKSIALSTLIASLTAAIFLSIKNKKDSDKNKEYPFAPFLSVAMIIAAFAGETLVNLYLGLFL